MKADVIPRAEDFYGAAEPKTLFWAQDGAAALLVPAIKSLVAFAQAKAKTCSVEEQVQVYQALAELEETEEDRRIAREIAKALSRAAALQLELTLSDNSKPQPGGKDGKQARGCEVKADVIPRAEDFFGAAEPKTLFLAQDGAAALLVTLCQGRWRHRMVRVRDPHKALDYAIQQGAGFVYFRAAQGAKH